MITEKVVYVTEDGRIFNVKGFAEKHQKLCKFRQDLENLVYQEDLLSQDREVILNFMEEKIEELSSIFFDLNNEQVCSFKEI